MKVSEHESSDVTMKLHIHILILFLLLTQSESRSKLDYRTKLELARRHYQRVAPQIACALPKPKIFRVGTTSMPLLPSATVLHRCGENSGCCSVATHKCVAKTKEKVKLYFRVKALPVLTSGRKKKIRIKKFMYFNHTECYCRDMSYKPR